MGYVERRQVVDGEPLLDSQGQGGQKVSRVIAHGNAAAQCAVGTRIGELYVTGRFGKQVTLEICGLR